MKTLMSVLVVAVLSAVVQADRAGAQQRPYTIGISGGVSIPIGAIDDHANAGFHVQPSVGFRLGDLPIGARFDLLYQELPDAVEGQFRQVAALLNGVLAPAMATIQPYGLIGAGFMHVTEPDLVPDADPTRRGETHSGFGLNAGVGLEFPFLGLSGVVEARILNLVGDQDTLGRSVPISVGIRF